MSVLGKSTEFSLGSLDSKVNIKPDSLSIHRLVIVFCDQAHGCEFSVLTKITARLGLKLKYIVEYLAMAKLKNVNRFFLLKVSRPPSILQC